MNKTVHFSAASCIGNTLLGEKYFVVNDLIGRWDAIIPSSYQSHNNISSVSVNLTKI